YRLNVVPIRLPPLRERLDDIGDLANHFLRNAAREGLGERRIDTAAIDRLRQHIWPGNIRELENLVRRLVAIYPQDTISADVIDLELTEVASAAAPAPGEPISDDDLAEMVERYLARHFANYGKDLPPKGLYDRILREVEKPLFTAALAATRGNQIKAAELLGLNRNTLRSRIKSLDIQVMRSPAG
ncbi:MAG: nitrogen regulation protein NR(I), partial [Hyphomicrobiaceae bacterium]|nr:nitrogen regulation protein NR(I) [Hyphomicrobiaceae bacterium]